MSVKYYDKSGATPQEKLLAGISPVDAILSGTSKNAIQNKAVFNALKEKIEVTVDHLVYFYNKSEVYNKEEVRALIGAIDTLTMEVVSSLPVSDISTTTIYLLKPSGSSVYDEYVYINNAWVKIGTTDMDLSGYMTTAAFNLAIADYYTKAEIDAMIADYYTKTQVDNLLQNVEIDVDNELSSTSENPVQNKVIKAELDKKQDKLTNPLTKSDVVNNLTTTTTNVPLSAAQGKAVNDKLTNFMSSGTNFVGIKNTNNAVTGGIGANGHAFVLGGDPSDTKHVNLYYDGSDVYCDGKFNSTSKNFKLNDSARSYSVTLSSKVQWVAGTPTRTNNTYYFGYVVQVKSGQTLAANETILTLPESTNVWCAIPNVTSDNGNYQTVVSGNKIYCEQSIASGVYITLQGSCPIL